MALGSSVWGFLFAFVALALELSDAKPYPYAVGESARAAADAGKDCTAQTQAEYYKLWQTANLKLGSALQSADLCHSAQKMLSGTDQRRAMKVKKYVTKKISAAIQTEQDKLNMERQELAAFKEEQCQHTAAPAGAQCVKEKLATIKMSSQHKICEAKVSSMSAETKMTLANHKAEMVAITNSVKKVQQLSAKGAEAGAQQDKSAKVSETSAKMSETGATMTEQHVHLLEAELSSKGKESSSAQQALKAAQAELKDCKTTTVDLAETRDLKLSAGECLTLTASHKHICEILGKSNPSCHQVSQSLRTGCGHVKVQKASVPTEKHTDLAQLDADYASFRQNDSNMKRYQDLLKANEVLKSHSSAWVSHETALMHQATEQRNEARNHKEKDIEKLQELENELKESNTASSWNSHEVQTQLHVLAAKQSEDLARVDGDYAQVQQEARKKDAEEDILKAAKLSGGKSAGWLQHQKQIIKATSQKEHLFKEQKQEDATLLQHVEGTMTSLRHSIKH